MPGLGSAGIIITMTVILAVAINSHAAQRKEILTSEHLALLRYVNEVTVSPDGNLVAYTVKMQRNPFKEENGSAWLELHVTDKSGQSRPFVTGMVKVSKPSFTPDGRHISYLAERGDDTVKSVYVIPVDGGESRKITDNCVTIDEYTWAPDSRHIAFVAKDSLTRDISGLRKKGFDQEVYEENWRHDRVWIYDIESGSYNPAPLTEGCSASRICWSPDGNMIALTMAPTPLIDDDYMARKVTVIDPTDGTVKTTFDNPGKLGQIAWSPDSKHLAIISGADINDPSAGEVLVGSVNAGELKPAITNFNGHVREVAWLDNKTIVYRSDEGVYTVIGTVNIDGSNRRVLVPGSDTPLEDMALSANRKTVVAIGSSYNLPWEAFYFDIGKNTPTRLTDSNPWLAGIRWARQEVITYTARDGLQLEGILIHPLDEESGKRYPLILAVHGGPESNHNNGWITWYSTPGQVAAARGFAVFYPNYRGSTGRGVEFSKMGQADYAGGEFDDLVDAVEHLVNIGLANKDRVGITGRSYGGFATAWASTALSEHFAAAVMGAGVSDLIAKFGTTDIPNEMFLVHARRWPWNYWQWYLERSPIYHAQKHQTPLLILHGEDDTRVHPSQSMELYRYLKTLGQAPVRLVFYKDEEHGTSNAAARYDANLRMLRWLEHYLIGPGGDPPPQDIDYSPLKAVGAMPAGTE